ncbi:MAG: hypothetical protein QM820_64385 [Minicystis sp.]
MAARRMMIGAAVAAWIGAASPALADGPVMPAPPPAAPPLGLAAAPVPCAPPMEPRSTPMMIGGIVMTATGGALLHFAALYPVLHDDGCFGGSCSNDRSVAGGLALAGVVAVAVGVPLLVLGSKHVPVRAAALGGPSGSGWAWRF